MSTQRMLALFGLRTMDLTQKITLVVERELRLAGFWESIPARNKLKAEIQEILLAPHKKGAMREWYIARAKERILPRVEKQARELSVSFGQARIVDNRYRWGSCTVRNNINLNWRLIKAPIFVVDYVIAHELAHLLEPNHTPRFWNIVKTQVPNMDRARDWLREHGQLLEEEV